MLLREWTFVATTVNGEGKMDRTEVANAILSALKAITGLVRAKTQLRLIDWADVEWQEDEKSAEKGIEERKRDFEEEFKGLKWHCAPYSIKWLRSRTLTEWRSERAEREALQRIERNGSAIQRWQQDQHRRATIQS